uniref:Acyltransferase n=1 Tax=Meloidogyne incognita TaxID=6306 RepID=A0A914KP83_MELIC
MLGWPFCSTVLVLYLLFSPKLWFFLFIYSIWLFYDWETPKRGSRPLKWFRELFLWKVLADYFNFKLVKTAELNNERNYIFGVHPHGVLATGSALTFGTDATNFKTLFPEIDVRIATLPVNFWFPLRREFLLAHGIISTDFESLNYFLNKSKNGKAIAIVTGGISEMLNSKPGEHTLTLANRKGFIKLALKCGADLVPVYIFGEDKIFVNFPNPKNSLIWKYQQFMRELTVPFKNLCFPLAYGCSFLTLFLPNNLANKLPSFLFYGILPFKERITSIVGEPIKVKKCENPSDKQIDDLHSEYCKNLIKLFEEHKYKYGELNENIKLKFI